MAKPPRGQTPRSSTSDRTGAQTGRSRPSQRGKRIRGREHVAAAQGRDNRKAKDEAAGPSNDDKANHKGSPRKKPGWARAAPPKKKHPGRSRPHEANETTRPDRQHEPNRERGAGNRHRRNAAERTDRSRTGGRDPERSTSSPHTKPPGNRSQDRASPLTPPPTGAPVAKMRISKAMAKAGLCSRRDAERWIAEGRVVVNGEKLDTPAREVGPEDRVLIDGQPMPNVESTRLWRYSKPKGLVTTHRDPEGRPTVFDDLPQDMPRLMSIGRLDYNTEGLLLLTTDGALARYLELPATGWLRRYRVRAHGRISQADLDPLKEGIEIEGIHYGPIEATLDSQQGANVWLTIGLREGKNREVRKILASLGLEVNRLIRVSFGPFQLLDLKPGSVELVRRKTLIDQLGARLAAQFNLADEPDEVVGPPPRHRNQTGTKNAPKIASRERTRRTDTRGPAPSGERSQTDTPLAKSREIHRNIPDTTAKDTQRKGTADRAGKSEFEDITDDQLDDIKPWDVQSDQGGRKGRRPTGLEMKRRRKIKNKPSGNRGGGPSSGRPDKE